MNGFAVRRISLMLCAMLAASTVAAEGRAHGSKSAFAVAGLGIGIFIPYSTIGGDFDGRRGILDINGDLLMLPRIAGGTGLGIELGVADYLSGVIGGAIFINAGGTHHSYRWQGYSGRMGDYFASLGGTFILMPKWRVQPRLSFSGGGQAFLLSEVDVTATGARTSTIMLGTFDLLSVGVNVFMTPRWKLWVEYGYRDRTVTTNSWDLQSAPAAGKHAIDLDAYGTTLTFGTTVAVFTPDRLARGSSE